MPGSVSLERGMRGAQYHGSNSGRVDLRRTQSPISALKPPNGPQTDDSYARLKKNKTEMLAHVSPATRS